ncbi:SprT family zinc-dependent metalloprotease [Jannaschia sp. LMIT008]|uniref:M48 family metallopeptidase n=1 Tax=Jannaschia maritima TaxID=3032585 RepID=UPI002810D2E7|nr:SprT family zinc-dependent metalloprotease [Jannaschia sp. LMIT008]
MTDPEGEDLVVTLGARRLPVRLVRSNRKTLGIAVHPDTRVVATAPHGAEHDAIERAIAGRGGWVLDAIREFERFLPRTPPRRYVSGETHLYLGREHRLVVDPDGLGVRRDGNRLVVGGRRDDTDGVRRALNRWYGVEARRVLSDRLDAGLALFAAQGVMRPALTVRRMEKRWGSMSNDGRRMLLNTRLVEAGTDEIDYVVAHELAHILEPHHGPAFHALLERKMPDWRARKDRLERRFA